MKLYKTAGDWHQFLCLFVCLFVWRNVAHFYFEVANVDSRWQGNVEAWRYMVFVTVLLEEPSRTWRHIVWQKPVFRESLQPSFSILKMTAVGSYATTWCHIAHVKRNTWISTKPNISELKFNSKNGYYSAPISTDNTFQDPPRLIPNAAYNIIFL
jgi:hypothetical protein